MFTEFAIMSSSSKRLRVGGWKANAISSESLRYRFVRSPLMHTYIEALCSRWKLLLDCTAVCERRRRRRSDSSKRRTLWTYAHSHLISVDQTLWTVRSCLSSNVEEPNQVKLTEYRIQYSQSQPLNTWLQPARIHIHINVGALMSRPFYWHQISFLSFLAHRLRDGLRLICITTASLNMCSESISPCDHVYRPWSRTEG